ncbi:MAG: glycosyltransferase [Prevotellaceae bacterium]|jgi:glycosyltransferase involved in cell wall biosynthesis|nr:glycosyltransferase [Prevotellaceae bacterium]
MKILIVNKFLYERGGADIHAIKLGPLLKKHGHQVRFYSMHYPLNIAMPDDEGFFAKEVSFFQTSPMGKLQAAMRVFGWGIKRNYTKLLDEFCPDVVHLHNVHSYLAPLVAALAHERSIKVVWTIHDYKMLCPSYACLRNNEPCELCYTNKFNVIRHRCMKHSWCASVLACGEALWWNKEKLSRWTDSFICSSHFIAEKMLQGGFPNEKISVLCNFVSDEKSGYIQEIAAEKEEMAYAYIGRLSEEKGLDALLKAAAALPYKLYVAGRGDMEAYLKQTYRSEQISFVGHLSAEGIVRLLKRVQFSVVPSVWYENNPHSAIESLCCGTPVLGRKVGGIPELLETSECNRSFVGDEELPTAIPRMFAQASGVDRAKLSADSCRLFSEEIYYRGWARIVAGEQVR